jgi:hypothetical protein
MALVVIMKSTGVANFAIAEMGLLAAFVGLSLVQMGLPFGLALLLALVSGIAAGVALEYGLMRRVPVRAPLPLLLTAAPWRGIVGTPAADGAGGAHIERARPSAGRARAASAGRRHFRDAGARGEGPRPPLRWERGLTRTGPAVRDGVQRFDRAAVQEINEAGGINGRKVRFIGLDDAFDPTRSVANVRRLVDQEKVYALVALSGGPGPVPLGRPATRAGDPARALRWAGPHPGVPRGRDRSTVRPGPGLKIAMPATAYDAKGMLLAAIRDPDPVLFCEPLRGYRLMRGEVPDGDYEVPLGKARIARQGQHVTLIAWSAAVQLCLDAADRLAGDGISATVVDVRSLVPFDVDTVVGAVTGTGRAVVVHEAPLSAGFGAEVVATIQEEAFYDLEAPLRRVAAWDTPFPPVRVEEHYLPSIDGSWRRPARYSRNEMSRYEFRVPDIGQGTAQVEIAAWLAQVGEELRENQPLVLLESEKATVDVASPVDGRLVELAGRVGDVLPVGGSWRCSRWPTRRPWARSRLPRRRGPKKLKDPPMWRPCGPAVSAHRPPFGGWHRDSGWTCPAFPAADPAAGSSAKTSSGLRPPAGKPRRPPAPSLPIIPGLGGADRPPAA